MVCSRASGIAVALVASLLALAVAAQAQQQVAPFEPGTAALDAPRPPLDLANGVVGLIETTYSDPEWVLATSDRILRSALCVAPCTPFIYSWYDQVDAPPCYPENRFYKLDGGVAEASAAPMAALGLGTFDGLYVRDVSFQLFSGATPVSESLSGPWFVSLSYWVTGNPACLGFEPNTTILTGGPGGLSSYSIVLTSRVDVRVDSNNDLTVDIEEKTDDAIEDTVGLSKGLLLPLNDNDSDGDGRPDSADTVINGLADEDDLRPVRVCLKPLPGQQGTVANVRWSVVPASQAGALRLYDAKGAYVLGAPAFNEAGKPLGEPVSEAVSELPLPAQACAWVDFRVEGVARGVVRLKAEALDDDDEPTGSDIVKLVAFRVRSRFPDAEEGGGDTSKPYASYADEGSVALVTSVDFLDEDGGQVNGDDATTVSWEVVSGQAHLSKTSSTLHQGAAVTVIAPPTAAGSEFQVSTRLEQIAVDGQTFPAAGPVSLAPVVTVRAGPATQLTLGTSTGQLSYPGTTTNELTVVAHAHDDEGNVIDDAEAAVVDLEGDGALAADDLAFSSGTASFQAVAGYSIDAQDITVSVGHAVAELTLDLVPVVLTLVSSAPSVISGSDAFLDVTVSAFSVDGSPLPNGTPVMWMTSLGSLGAPAGPRTGPVTQTALANGQSVVRLHTACTDLEGNVVPGTDIAGFAQVFALIGMSRGELTVPFRAPTGTPPPLRLVVAHRALAGDAVTDGVVAIDAVDYLSQDDLVSSIDASLGEEADLFPAGDLDGDGLITLVDLILARNTPAPPPPTAPYFAVTTCEIQGAPGDIVHVALSDATYLQLVGVDAGGFLTLGPSGQGVVLLQSKGVLAHDGPVFVDVHATRLPLPLAPDTAAGRDGADDATATDRDDPDSEDVRVVFLEKEEHGVTYNFLAGLGGGGRGGVAFASDALVSLIVIGDIRDFLIETGKFWPGGEAPDGLVMGFSGLGIASTAAVPGDVGITLLKRLLKKLNAMGGGKGLKVVVRAIEDILQAIKDDLPFLEALAKWSPLFRAMHDNLNLCKLCAHLSDETLELARKVTASLGKEWGEHLGDVAFELQKASIPFKVIKRGATKVLMVMDKVDAATIALIKGLDPTRQKRLVKAIAQCEGVLEAGAKVGSRIEDVQLGLLLDSHRIQKLETFLAADPALGATFDDVIERLGRVSAHGTVGISGIATDIRGHLDKVGDTLIGTGTSEANNLYGSLNELAKLAEYAGQPDKYKVIRTGIRENTLFRPSKEIDALVLDKLSDQKLLVELKYSFSGGPDAIDKLLDQTAERVELVLEDARFAGAKVVVDLAKGSWPPEVKQQLIAKGKDGVVVEVFP
jgi:hypothetical protein